MGTVTGSEGAFSRRRQGGYSLPRGEPGEKWTLVFRVQAMRGVGEVGTGDSREAQGHRMVMGCSRWGGGTTGRDLGD